ncbi:MAG TPA: HAD-IIB family hydrolase [Candidatus Saccharimonadales bacterium]|jgi:HAD superfamily hydrolase (TIGR01484 family)|nr:HAD-IIB family hydrolase [Candidatus Saccharimonadales bacterium]
MRRKVIAFDLDGTLAPSKSALPDRMAELLDRLLDQYHVCIISGGKFGIYEENVLPRLNADPARLERLHLMPTCGTRYMKYDVASAKWETVYAEDLTEAGKKKISDVLSKVVKDLGYEEKEVYGEIIEDRGSQISWSALGQDIVTVLGEEGVRRKEEWDADNTKKEKIRAAAADLLPEFEVRAGGLTTIDVTLPGIDKAYGMKKLMELLEIGKEEIFFIGDRIYEGGNDYPVKIMGIDTLQIGHWKETASAVEAIIQVS